VEQTSENLQEVADWIERATKHPGIRLGNSYPIGKSADGKIYATVLGLALIGKLNDPFKALLAYQQELDENYELGFTAVIGQLLGVGVKELNYLKDLYDYPKHLPIEEIIRRVRKRTA